MEKFSDVVKIINICGTDITDPGLLEDLGIIIESQMLINVNKHNSLKSTKNPYGYWSDELKEPRYIEGIGNIKKV